jgi:regulator of cell morphogenesis and NO signaling
MANEVFERKMLGEIVTDDFRAAEVFKEAGIDFCCGGEKTLKQACEEKKIDLMSVMEKLNELDLSPSGQTHNFKDWDPGFLADYIVNIHHKFVIKTLPDLVFYTEKIASVHGLHHPELIEVAGLFGQLNNELWQHLKNEEEVLFPAIRDAIKNNTTKSRSIIRSEISRMTAEHEFAGGTMDKINGITSNYLVPEDGCNSYRVAFKLLQQFEDDLHIHVHLENNILYPKALKL